MVANNHALVIGGTGMLAEVCLYLASEGYCVSVIGRTKSKFEIMKLQSPPHSIFPIVTDYNTKEVFHEIKEATKKRGPFNLIVSWTPNYSTLERICEMNSGIDSFRLIQIKGSRRYFENQPIQIPTHCNYREVYLGFVTEENTTRWLTHSEIANGVIKQIESDELKGIIGQIHPYESRPS